MSTLPRNADAAPLREADVPVLIVAFPLEAKPKALNACDLTEHELRQVVDWVANHGELKLWEWLDRHLVSRGIREAA